MTDWVRLVRDIVVEPQLYLRKEFNMRTPEEELQDRSGVNDPEPRCKHCHETAEQCVCDTFEEMLPEDFRDLED